MDDPQSAPAAAPAWEGDIRDVEERCRLAFLAAEIETLRGMWSDRLVVNSPINRIHGREQVLDLLARGVIRHHSMETHVESLSRHGDVVVVMGRDVIVDAPGGPAVNRRFTNVWQERDGAWVLVARQATIVAVTPPA